MTCQVINHSPDDGWIQCSDELPPEGEVVETKIHDADGCRNETTLRRYHNLWFFPANGGTYVWYTPTHWRRTG